jgi:hypothetical protein
MIAGMHRILRRVPKPSPALLIGLLALVVATTGTAVAATGTGVNIVDGTNAAQVAKVDTGGALKVGDGSGPLTVDGHTTEAAPANFVRFVAPSGDTCTVVYTAPADKALVIKTIEYIVFPESPGTYVQQTLYLNSGSEPCGTFVAIGGDSVHSAHVTNIEPGLLIRPGRTLASVGPPDDGSAIIYGYLVPASSLSS